MICKAAFVGYWKERSVDVGPGSPGGLVDVLHGGGYAVCYDTKRRREPEMPWIVGVLQRCALISRTSRQPSRYGILFEFSTTRPKGEHSWCGLIMPMLS
jgi:hypothetical protein